jgi:hypothetical protein
VADKTVFLPVLLFPFNGEETEEEVKTLAPPLLQQRTFCLAEFAVRKYPEVGEGEVVNKEVDLRMGVNASWRRAFDTIIDSIMNSNRMCFFQSIIFGSWRVMYLIGLKYRIAEL